LQNYKPFHQPLKAIRERLDLVQEPLAERLGESVTTANCWEGDVTVLQRTAPTAITTLAAEGFGDGTRERL